MYKIFKRRPRCLYFWYFSLNFQITPNIVSCVLIFMKLTLKEYFYKHAKAVIFLVVALSFLIKMNMLFSYINYGPDGIVQTITAQSMLKGHGISLPEADVHDLSKTVYKPYGLFPPGFALTVAPLLLITHNDIVLSIRILLIIGFALFYLVWLKIFYVLKDYIQHEIVIIAIFIFWGINYSPLNMGSVTDVFSLTLISAAILYFLKIMIPASENRKKLFLYAVLIGLFSFLAAFYRFAYYPLAFAVPVFFLAFALFYKKEWRVPAWLSFIIVSILFVSLLVFQKLNTGPVIWVNKGNEVGRIYWENLKNYDAIFLNSLLSDQIFYRTLAEDSLKVNASMTLFKLLFPLSFLISILFFLVAGQFIVKSKLLKNKLKNLIKNPLGLFIIIILGTSFGAVLFYTIISVRYPSFSMDPSYAVSWVSLPRYFMIFFVSVQVLLFVLLFNKQVKINKYLKYTTLGVITIACFITCAFRLYHEKKFQCYKPEEVAADYFKLSDHIKKSTAQIVVVKTIPEEYLYRYAMLNGANIIDFDSIKKSAYASKPILLYTPVYINDSLNEFYTFAKESGAKKIMKLENLQVEIFSKTTGN